MPTTGSMPGLKAFAAAVFGGIGSVPGAVVGAFVIGICENIMKGAGLTTFSDAFTFVLLIVILIGEADRYLRRKKHQQGIGRGRNGTDIIEKNKTACSIIAIAVFLILVYLGDSFIMPTSKWSMLMKVLEKGSIYALIAVSMNLLNGFTGLFSLGQAGFMLIGAYALRDFCDSGSRS